MLNYQSYLNESEYELSSQKILPQTTNQPNNKNNRLIHNYVVRSGTIVQFERNLDKYKNLIFENKYSKYIKLLQQQRVSPVFSKKNSLKKINQLFSFNKNWKCKLEDEIQILSFDRNNLRKDKVEKDGHHKRNKTEVQQKYHDFGQEKWKNMQKTIEKDQYKIKFPQIAMFKDALKIEQQLLPKLIKQTEQTSSKLVTSPNSLQKSKQKGDKKSQKLIVVRQIKQKRKAEKHPQLSGWTVNKF